MMQTSLYKFLQNLSPSYEPFEMTLSLCSDEGVKTNVKISHGHGNVEKQVATWWPETIDPRNTMFLPCRLPGVTKEMEKHMEGHILCEPNATFYVVYRGTGNKLYAKAIYEGVSDEMMKAVFETIVDGNSIAFIDNNLDCYFLNETSVDDIVGIRGSILILYIIFNEMKNLLKLTTIYNKVEDAIEDLKTTAQSAIENLNITTKEIYEDDFINQKINELQRLISLVNDTSQSNENNIDFESTTNDINNVLNEIEKWMIEWDEQRN